MTVERIVMPERKIVVPGYVTVIGDDEYDQSAKTQDALLAASAGLSLESGPVLRPNGWHGLFVQALTGNNGQQADVVLLDERYSNGTFAWIPREEGLQELFKQSGIDFDATSIPRILLYPDSINFSLLLRLLGYKKNIFIVSSDPPPADDFIIPLWLLQQKVPKQRLPFPANGYSSKKPAFNQDHVWCGTGITFERERYHWVEQMVQGTLTESLQVLLRNPQT